MQLNINDKNWKLVWGTGALENLCNQLNMTLNEVDVAIMLGDEKVVNRLAYCALQNGAEIQDSEVDFTYKYFLAWLDEQEEGLGQEISNDFLKSKYLGKTMEDRYNEVIARLTANETPGTAPSKKKSKPTRSVKSSATGTSG